MSRPAERGVALLNALIILAVVAGLAAGMMRASGQVHGLLMLGINADRARTALSWCDAAAEQRLSQDLVQSTTDHPGESWAERDWVIDRQGSTIAVGIEDAQGRFDLARIKSRAGQWQRLVEALEGSPDEANQALEAGIGVPSQLYGVLGNARALQPFVVRLPQAMPLNVNTAKQPVLAALSPVLTERDVDRIRAARPFEDVAQFTALLSQRLPPDAMAALTQPFSVASRFFLIECFVRHERSAARWVRLVERSDEGFKTHWRLETAP